VELSGNSLSRAMKPMQLGIGDLFFIAVAAGLPARNLTYEICGSIELGN